MGRKMVKKQRLTPLTFWLNISTSKRMLNFRLNDLKFAQNYFIWPELLYFDLISKV